MRREVVIGSRDSALALWQTNWVLEKLRQAHPERAFRVQAVKTKGDKLLDVALARIGDKGLFTKELELDLLERKIDLAVHSMKDVPTTLPEGLCIGAITPRHDPSDVLLSARGLPLQELPAGARLGTSSLRRKAQLWQYRPDLVLLDLRGNLQTRLRKMEEMELDGIVLAAAGVDRLGWSNRITQRLPFNICLPAVGQGALAVEIRAGDADVQALVAPLNDDLTGWPVRAERALMLELEGGCQVPIGALGELRGDTLALDGLVASLDGRDVVRAQVEGEAAAAEAVGKELATLLLGLGADRILEQVRKGMDAGGK